MRDAIKIAVPTTIAIILVLAATPLVYEATYRWFLFS